MRAPSNWSVYTVSGSSTSLTVKSKKEAIDFRCLECTHAHKQRSLLNAWGMNTSHCKTAGPLPHLHMAVNKTRLVKEGSVADLKGGYTFFWKGKARDEEQIHGVGLTVKSLLLKQLPDLPTSVNEWLMELCSPLHRIQHITIISMNAPTLTSSDEMKEAFYEKLGTLVRDTPSSERLILEGDFNTWIRADPIPAYRSNAPQDAESHQVGVQSCQTWTISASQQIRRRPGWPTDCSWTPDWMPNTKVVAVQHTGEGVSKDHRGP